MTAVGGVAELSFAGPVLSVAFRHADSVVEVPAFWDGGDVHRARFSPGTAGEWSWSTRSTVEEFDGLTGSFTASPREGSGAVGVVETYHFAHADGTPYRPVGATVYNWLHQTDDLMAATVDSLSAAGLNKLRFLVFPQAGGHVEHVPTLLPFEKDAGGRWDVTRPVPSFFQRLDRAVLTLASRGIQADVLILNSYDGGAFGLDGLTEEEDAVYLRYLVARLSAYANVWWSLCNEFDLLPRPVERWTRLGELLAALDPHQRLRSIHQWMRFYDHNQRWVTHASIQNGAATEEFGRASLYRDAYPKPIVLDEIKYEGDIADRWGHLSGEELVHRFWVATVAGCYASHGESFLTASGSLHIVEGGELRGTSPARLGFLRRVLEELVVPGLDPIDRWDDPAYVAGVARAQYVQYLGRSAPAAWTFRLPQGNVGERLEVGDVFEVEVIDTWRMTVTPVGRRFTLTEVQRNDVFADAELDLPEGEALALRITRVG